MDAIRKYIHIAYELIFTIYAPLFILYFFLNYGLFYIYNLLEGYPLYRYLVTGVLAVIAFIIFVLIFIKAYKLRIINRARILYGCPDVDVRRADVRMVCRPDGNYVFERRLTIRAIQDGVSSFQSIFDYRGKREDFALTGSEGASIQIYKPSDDGPYHVYMDFNPALRKNETREIYYKVEVHDSHGVMGKFFGHICSFPISEYIRQDVVFEGVPRPGAAKEKIFEAIYNGPSITREIRVENNRISHTIRRPKIGYRYVLDWS